MKSITGWCTVTGCLLICLSAKISLNGVRTPGDTQTGKTLIVPPPSEGRPGTRANLLKGQSAVIEVKGTAFDQGRFNGSYVECGMHNSAPLYRMEKSSRYCGWSPESHRWVIGFDITSINSSTGIYFSKNGTAKNFPTSGWTASRVWPNSAPAPTVSLVAGSFHTKKSSSKAR